MATKKDAATTPQPKRPHVKPAVLTITADQFLAGIKRFDNACTIMERLAPSLETDGLRKPLVSPANQAMSYSDAPQPAPESVQQMVDYLADLASQVVASSSTIRMRVLGQEDLKENGPMPAEPSQGRIKDRITIVRQSVLRDSARPRPDRHIHHRQLALTPARPWRHSRAARRSRMASQCACGKRLSMYNPMAVCFACRWADVNSPGQFEKGTARAGERTDAFCSRGCGRQRHTGPCRLDKATTQ